jgi:hypothetical protein
MPTRPKDIGTAGETAVLKVVRVFWPLAHREVLHAHADLGDIVIPGVPIIFEVKAGKQTQTVSDLQLEQWMRETDRERDNAEARYGVLVLKRWGVGAQNADRWWAYLDVAALAQLMGAPGHLNAAPVRMELGDLLGIFADMGWTTDAPSEEDLADAG